MARALKDFKILLVDDRQENLVALEEMLETEERTFLTATSGNEALKLALKYDDIGLILLDVQMPGMDGFEVARLLKANPRTKDISIVFVTALNNEEEYVMRGFDEGAVDYLQKPLDINVTRAKVKVFEKLYFYQRELRLALGDIEKINKQLQQFVYIVAHDLKSPLSGITGMLHMMNEESVVSEHPLLQEYVGLSLSASEHLSGMISAILDYSKKNIDEQAVEHVDVNEMVTEIAHLLFPPAHVRIVVKTTLPVLKTKKIKLQQVFQNLIGNAIKYNDKPNALIEIGHTDNDAHVEFYVKDNGPGIFEEDQNRIFGLFHTTANKSAGDSSTGVGLNIVKLMIEEQGGKIWVESAPVAGSCFYFTWVK